jgi:hypothetical protein
MHNRLFAAYIIPKGGIAVIWDWLLASVSVYLLAPLSIHLLCGWKKAQGEKQVLVIVTSNNQMMIEWVVRSRYFLAWLKGESSKITIVDQGSNDDTEKIIRQLSYYRTIDWVPLADEREVDVWLEEKMAGKSVSQMEIMDLRDPEPMGWSYYGER